MIMFIPIITFLIRLFIFSLRKNPDWISLTVWFFSNTQEGYCNIVIENADNSEIILRKSTFIGGTYYAGYGSYLDGHINGSDGISIEKCQGLIVNIDGCSFEGGEGSQARAQRIPVLEGGGKGGNGFAVHDSTIHLYFDSAPSLFNGGKGGDGGVLFDTFINAGNGGDGISLINSVVTVSADIEQPYQAFGGQGRDRENTGWLFC